MLLVKQYQTLLSYDDVELEFDDEALQEIANKAIERKTGRVVFAPLSKKPC